ncbi:MAG: hypothetical protein ACR2NY_01190 [Alphaproteobacteria bacterium]
MMKFFNIILLALWLVVAGGCRSKCSPLDRTYPSERDDNQAFLFQPPSTDGAQIKNFACVDKKLVLKIKNLI